MSNIPMPVYRDSNFKTAERTADLLSRMTLKEKIAQLHCHGRVVEMEGILFNEDGNIIKEKMNELFSNGMCQLGRPSQPNTPEKAAQITNAIQKYLVEETRLGIPAFFNEEGLHGLMGVGATSFPTPIALASCWDEDLIEQIFAVVARETRSRGSNYAYAPVLDLARDARWGRVEETFGEDPFLVSRLGVAAIKGLQGEGEKVDEEHVIACAKHYAVHGQPESGLNSAPGNISERVIREEFLPPFQAAVQEAGVKAVMASYNEVDGIPVHVNRWLLKDILRDEWGYRGFVTSDGYGVPQIYRLHHVARDAAEAGTMAINAGIDNEVPQGRCFAFLEEAVEKGDVSMETIDRAVSNILRAKIDLGLLDQTPHVDVKRAVEVNNCKEHRDLALQAAHKAAILLKNENQALPLNVEALKTIAVIGPNAADLHLGCYAADSDCGCSVLEGIQNRVGDKISVTYAEGCRLTEEPRGYQAWHEHEVKVADPAKDTDRITEAVAVAEQADTVILVLGGNEGTCREGWWFDHLGDRDDLSMFGRQEELAAAVLANGKPVVVVLLNGRPLSIGYLKDHAPAILECWYLGQETGIAVADILFGDVNPSGKLPVTFPRSVGQIPYYYYYRPSAKRGYLFTETKPLFPFGFGLSYTRFSYGAPRLRSEKIKLDESTEVTVTVTNSGHCAGEEVVQLYIRDQVASVTRPVKLLKGFKRICLEPEETGEAVFTITPDMLSLWNREMEWCLEPGLFDIMVGASSEETQTVILEVCSEFCDKP